MVKFNLVEYNDDIDMREFILEKEGVSIELSGKGVYGSYDCFEICFGKSCLDDVYVFGVVCLEKEKIRISFGSRYLWFDVNSNELEIKDR